MEMDQIISIEVFDNKTENDIKDFFIRSKNRFN